MMLRNDGVHVYFTGHDSVPWFASFLISRVMTHRLADFLLLLATGGGGLHNTRADYRRAASLS